MKKLKSYKFVTTKRGKYPWDEWFDGTIRQAEAGVDYTTTDRAFLSALYRMSKLLGLKARASLPEKGVVVFQCPVPEGEGDE